MYSPLNFYNTQEDGSKEFFFEAPGGVRWQHLLYGFRVTSGNLIVNIKRGEVTYIKGVFNDSDGGIGIDIPKHYYKSIRLYSR